MVMVVSGGEWRGGEWRGGGEEEEEMVVVRGGRVLLCLPGWGMEWTGTWKSPKAHLAMDAFISMPLNLPPKAVTVKPP